ncbi:response regulator transcription factor [Spiractinospora alimapuensis]|uniref:response regulator n=1 Tax=Spiractinospora alimapuensis TaxID=2820884 RepID=UPI001F474C4A|nr:response regulator transcription factor [Spiractinospora alimapuensis]QVQ50107.1 response regulator transcription factor [Spiractinospora alimapuensis]
MTIRVLIADDQPAAREGLRMILSGVDDIEVIGTAADGRELLALAERRRPDVVLTDIRMPGMDGIEAIRRIAQLDPAPPMVALTTFDIDEYLFGALQAGAVGFLLKESNPEQFVDAVRTAHDGQGVIDPRVTPRLVRRFAETSPRSAPTESTDLTPRETEVLAGVARGNSNQQIASELFIAQGTVKIHVANILTKLGLRSRVEAAVYAYRYGIVTWSGAPDSRKQ